MNRDSRVLLISLAALMAVWIGTAAVVAAQAPESAKPTTRGAQRAPRAGRPNPKPGAQPAQGGAKSDGKPGAKPDAKKGGDAKKDAKKDETPQTVKRPEKPLDPPDPSELKAKPDSEGMIRFNFRGQAWPDVLNWLSNVSGLSLDWQELPPGFLNLTTQRRYTIDESRDLINRHLMARGFTMLVNDEVVSVVNLSKLDPGMVPRVTPEELSKRMRHDYVKVSFQLDWMLAEQAAEELKPMLSPHGKLHPFKNTNRLEALDAVANLREIGDLLRQEQSDRGQERLMREFQLTHVRASDVLAQLEGLLGLESKKASVPMTSRQMQQMQRQQQEMMQQMQRNGGKAVPAPKKEASVNLVVNPRKNSVLAHAPPDKMAIIEQAIATIDVPNDRRQSLLANPKRMQVYRLHALDPAMVVKTLEELGELEPTTHLEVDEKNNAIIAYASLADQLTIRQLVDRLDGSGRRFEVIRLRRLAADYVAGTVDFMMGGDEEEQPQNSRYFYYGRQQPKNENKDKFRVDADVENNFLLLWASEIEKAEVLNLLVKLGELPPEGGNSTTMRVLNAVPPEDLERILKQLRNAWPSLSPNPLSLPPRADRPAESRPETKSTTPKSTTEALHDVPEDRAPVHLTAMQTEQDSQAGSAFSQRRTAPVATDNQAPVNISVGPDGRLVITSQDTQALDIMEELVNQLVPSNPSYKVFRLKHADAFYVKLNLVDFFEDDEEENNGRTVRYYYYDPPARDSKKKFRLSERRKLKFIYDYDTNSILVQGADPQQLQVIGELIALYDQPEPADSQSARLIRSFQIKYSKASLIASTIKEVYRDLLSSNDKALAQNPEQKNRGGGQGTTYIFGERDSNDAPQRTPVNFKGKLSLGVDDLSNTLLISAEGDNLMNNLTLMVEELDAAARPTANVSVIKLDGPLNTSAVRDVVASVLGAQAMQTAQPPQQAQGQPQGGPNKQPQGNGRGRGNAALRAE